MKVGKFEKKLVWLVVNLLFLSVFSVSAEDKITWLYSDFPPVQIETGPYAKQGIADFIVQLLIKNLVGFKHDQLKSNYARAMALLKEQEMVAHPALLKRPDRELYSEFSIPTYVMLPNEILVPEHSVNKLKPFIDEEGLFLLEKAIVQSDLALGIASERAYGGIIDEILKKHQDHPNIYIRYDVKLLAHFFKMMEFDKIDYIIGYPVEGQYFRK